MPNRIVINDEELHSKLSLLNEATTDNLTELLQLIDLDPKVALRGADLREANLTREDLHSANLEEVDLQNSMVDKSIFIGASLQNANLSGSLLTNTSFAQASLIGANFSEAHLTAVDFSSARLDGAAFTGATLNKVKFLRSDISNVLFDWLNPGSVNNRGEPNEYHSTIENPNEKEISRIILIGMQRPGRTPLTATLIKVQGTKGMVNCITHERSNAPDAHNENTQINASPNIRLEVDFETENRLYSYADFSLCSSFPPAIFSTAHYIDGAILIVPFQDVLDLQTRSHILLARSLWIPKLVVLLDGAHEVEDQELRDLNELSIRELLTRYGFDGDQTPVIFGSPDVAVEGQLEESAISPIQRLLKALDSHFQSSQVRSDKPFLMSIEEVKTITHGTVVMGFPERGQVSIGQMVEIVGLRPSTKAMVKAVEVLRRTEGQSPMHGILLGGVTTQVERGMVLAEPGTIVSHSNFVGNIRFLPRINEGLQFPYTMTFSSSLYFGKEAVEGRVEFDAGVESSVPGSDVLCRASLARPIFMRQGSRFEVRTGNELIGVGVVQMVI